MVDQVKGGGGFSAEVRADSLIRAAKFFPKAHAREIRTALRNIGASWTRRVKMRFGTPRGLKVRSGALRSSINYRVSSDGESVAFLAGGARAPYARSQEFGAKIRPRKANGFLAVPMPDARTAGGDISGRAMIRKRGADFVTDFGPTFIITAKNGRRYIAVKDGSDVKFLYSLKKSVTIPGPDSDGTHSRLGAVETMERKGPMTAFVTKQMQDAARRALK